MISEGRPNSASMDASCDLPDHVQPNEHVFDQRKRRSGHIELNPNSRVPREPLQVALSHEKHVIPFCLVEIHVFFLV